MAMSENSQPMLFAETELPLTSSAADSPVKTCRSLESGLASRVRELVFGGNSGVLLASFDPATSSLKTCQASLVPEQESFSETLPRSGIMLSGNVYQRAPLAPLTDETDGGLWPTPMAGTPAQNGNNEAGNNDSSRKTVALAGWPTPTASSGTGAGTSGRDGGLNLQTAAALAGWPTPAARDWKSSASNQHGINARPLNEVARLAEWPTPRASDGEKNVRTQSGAEAEIRRKGGPQDLCTAAAVATWATPKASDCSGERTTKTKGGGNLHLDSQARLTSGRIASGSTAPITSGGQLNPEHSRWLMGFPKGWLNVEPLATRSSRSSRKS